MFIKESHLIKLTKDLKTCLMRNNLGPYNPSLSKTHLFCSNCEQVVDWRKCCEMQLRICFNLILICSGDYDCSRIFSICNDFEMANRQLKTVDARFFCNIVHNSSKIRRNTGPNSSCNWRSAAVIDGVYVISVTMNIRVLIPSRRSVLRSNFF